MKIVKNLYKEINLEDKCYKFCYRLIERDSVDKISPNKDKVEVLVEKLHKYEVSPIHLIDVIGEDVDNCVADFAF